MKKKEIIFGIHPIIEALDSGKSISKIWIKNSTSHPGHKKIWEISKKKNIPCSRVPIVKLRQLTSGQHQGVVALLAPVNFYSISNIIQQVYTEGRAPLVVVLSHIQDSRNLGALIRTASAAQVDALIMPLQGTTIIDGNTMKTSAGALAHMPICRVSNLEKTLIFLQESGLQIISCTEKATQNYYNVHYTPPTALLFGGEDTGIAEEYLPLSSAQVKIPMNPAINSLNLSVATAVVLYEAIRQRQN